MRTVGFAIAVFGAAFAAVVAYGWYMARIPEQAAVEVQVPSLDVAFARLQAAYREMDASCTAEARRDYGAAYVTLLAAVSKEQTEGTYDALDWHNKRNWAMNQFVEAAARGILVRSDFPDLEFGRMVAALNDAGVIPLTAGEQLFGRYKDADGEPMKPSRCEPL